jgi:hypothetical protein
MWEIVLWHLYFRNLGVRADKKTNDVAPLHCTSNDSCNVHKPELSPCIGYDADRCWWNEPENSEYTSGYRDEWFKLSECNQRRFDVEPCAGRHRDLPTSSLHLQKMRFYATRPSIHARNKPHKSTNAFRSQNEELIRSSQPRIDFRFVLNRKYNTQPWILARLPRFRNSCPVEILLNGWFLIFSHHKGGMWKKISEATAPIPESDSFRRWFRKYQLVDVSTIKLFDPSTLHPSIVMASLLGSSQS